MSDGEFSDFEIFQHSGKGIPLFMPGHKNCLQSDYFFGTGPSSYIKKKNLPGRGLTKVEKHCPSGLLTNFYSRDIALCDFHLFGPRKKRLAGRRFTEDADMKQAVTSWLHT
jgi:hypothetical protein